MPGPEIIWATSQRSLENTVPLELSLISSSKDIGGFWSISFGKFIRAARSVPNMKEIKIQFSFFTYSICFQKNLYDVFLQSHEHIAMWEDWEPREYLVLQPICVLLDSRPTRTLHPFSSDKIQYSSWSYALHVKYVNKTLSYFIL
jgi:hypothetical protein